MSLQHGQPRHLEPVVADAPRRQGRHRKAPVQNFWVAYYMKHPEYSEHEGLAWWPDMEEARRYVRWLYRNANPLGLVT